MGFNMHNTYNDIQSAKPWHDFKRIFCIRADSVGDVIMMSPAIRALKESVPGRRITFLASSSGAEAARMITEIDEIITVDMPWEKNQNPASSSVLQKAINNVKKHGFEGAVLFTSFSQNPYASAMFCYLAGIAKILSYSKENPFSFIKDFKMDTEPFSKIIHEVERQLALVGLVGAYTKDQKLNLYITEDTRLQVKRKIIKLGLKEKDRFIIVHPVVSDPKRQYPITLFTQAIKKLLHELPHKIILTGLKSQNQIISKIIKDTNLQIYSLAGKLTLPELAALIEESELLIANNTGPVHIAAAVDTPVVDLYARTNPQHTPWMVKNRVLYFDVPENHQSKNSWLTFKVPKNKSLLPEPEHIVTAAKELLMGYPSGSLPEEITTWE